MLYNRCQIATSELLRRSTSTDKNKFPYMEYEGIFTNHMGKKVLVLVPYLWNIADWHKLGSDHSDHTGPHCHTCVRYASLDVPKAVKKHYCAIGKVAYDRVVVLPGLCSACVHKVDFRLGTHVDGDVVMNERTLRRALRTTQSIWTDPQLVAYDYNWSARQPGCCQASDIRRNNAFLDGFIPARCYDELVIGRWSHILRNLYIDDE